MPPSQLLLFQNLVLFNVNKIRLGDTCAGNTLSDLSGFEGTDAMH